MAAQHGTRLLVACVLVFLGITEAVALNPFAGQSMLVSYTAALNVQPKAIVKIHLSCVFDGEVVANDFVWLPESWDTPQTWLFNTTEPEILNLCVYTSWSPDCRFVGVGSFVTFQIQLVSVGIYYEDILLTPPVVVTQVFRVVALPTDTITLDASMSAAVATLATLNGATWELMDGPSKAVINSPNGLTTTVTGLIAGDYRFKLTIRDTYGGTQTSTITVRVVDLQLTSPSGMSTVCFIGDPCPVAWSPLNVDSGATAWIDLMRDGVLVRRVASSVKITDRALPWTIPVSVLPGNYTMRIMAVQTKAVGDVVVTDLPVLSIGVGQQFAIASKYRWVTSSWSACTGACGHEGGSRTRSVVCLNQATRDAALSSVCAASAPAPDASEACFVAHCAAVGWRVGAWSDCSKTCGGGQQTRLVYCEHAASRTALDNSVCEGTPAAGAMPPATRTCNAQACPVCTWISSKWDACTQPCGGGLQFREVRCGDVNGNTQPESCCAAAGATMPPTVQSCNADKCIGAFYVTGAWGACSAACGTGVARRAVNCVAPTGVGSNVVPSDQCDVTKRPADFQVCNTRPCEQYSYALSKYGQCDVTACGVTGTAQRSYTCTKADGTQVDASYCGAASTALPPLRKPCAAAQCADCGQSCSGHGTCGASGCSCQASWTGSVCQSSTSCPGGALLADNTCCQGSLTATGTCCSGASAIVDVSGECCTSGHIDECGVCDGSGHIDVAGECCTGDVDAQGFCCDGKVDVCGVCNGVGACNTQVDVCVSATTTSSDPSTLVASSSTDRTKLEQQLLLQLASAFGVSVDQLLVNGLVMGCGSNGRRLHAYEQAAPVGTPRGRKLGSTAQVTASVVVSPDAAGTPVNLASVSNPVISTQAVGGVQLMGVQDVSFVGICGNGVCESGEMCVTTGSTSCCPTDCTIALFDCPVDAAGVTCAGRGRCQRTTGQCLCNAGFTGELCDACAEGYVSMGKTCSPIWGVSPACKCDKNARCISTPNLSAYKCQCKDGYMGDGYTCVDIDECAAGADSCHNAASCINTAGSYKCICPAGYVGDGTSCMISVTLESPNVPTSANNVLTFTATYGTTLDHLADRFRLTTKRFHTESVALAVKTAVALPAANKAVLTVTVIPPIHGGYVKVELVHPEVGLVSPVVPVQIAYVPPTVNFTLSTNLPLTVPRFSLTATFATPVSGLTTANFAFSTLASQISWALTATTPTRAVLDVTVKNPSQAGVIYLQFVPQNGKVVPLPEAPKQLIMPVQPLTVVLSTSAPNPVYSRQVQVVMTTSSPLAGANSALVISSKGAIVTASKVTEVAPTRYTIDLWLGPTAGTITIDFDNTAEHLYATVAPVKSMVLLYGGSCTNDECGLAMPNPQAVCTDGAGTCSPFASPGACADGHLPCAGVLPSSSLPRGPVCRTCVGDTFGDCSTSSGVCSVMGSDNACPAGSSTCNPCTHVSCGAGSCVAAGSVGVCQCPAGWTGDACNVKLTPCDTFACDNGGECSVVNGAPRCTCQVGFSGVHCSENIDDCASALCVNGATCIDGVRSFSCQCAPGYSGVFCEHDIDECAAGAAVCAPNAVCVNTPGSYKCECPQGFEGDGVNVCNSVLSCTPSPCVNGGTCAMERGFPKCTCPSGYRGSRCEVALCSGCKAGTSGSCMRKTGECVPFLAGASLCPPDTMSCLGAEIVGGPTSDQCNGCVSGEGPCRDIDVGMCFTRMDASGACPGRAVACSPVLAMGADPSGLATWTASFALVGQSFVAWRNRHSTLLCQAVLQTVLAGDNQEWSCRVLAVWQPTVFHASLAHAYSTGVSVAITVPRSVNATVPALILASSASSGTFVAVLQSVGLTSVSSVVGVSGSLVPASAAVPTDNMPVDELPGTASGLSGGIIALIVVAVLLAVGGAVMVVWFRRARHSTLVTAPFAAAEPISDVLKQPASFTPAAVGASSGSADPLSRPAGPLGKPALGGRPSPRTNQITPM